MFRKGTCAREVGSWLWEGGRCEAEVAGEGFEGDGKGDAEKRFGRSGRRVENRCESVDGRLQSGW
jgi:hypothetical protein